MGIDSPVKSKESGTSKIVMIIMGVIVVGLLIAVVVVAISKNQQNKTTEEATNSGETVVDELATKEASPSAEETNLAPVANGETGATVSSQVSSQTSAGTTVAVGGNTESGTAIPKTGAADFVPLAILTGAFFMYLTSVYMNKREMI